jgi:hypothetical protein
MEDAISIFCSYEIKEDQIILKKREKKTHRKAVALQRGTPIHLKIHHLQAVPLTLFISHSCTPTSVWIMQRTFTEVK